MHPCGATPRLSRRSRRFAQLPDILDGPVPGPLGFSRVPVGAGRSAGWASLDQVFHHQVCLAEEPDPLPVGQLEVDLIFPLQAVQAEVVIDEGSLELVRLHVLAEYGDWRRGGEGKKPAATEQPGRLGNGTPGVTEGHGSPIAEDDIEAAIRQWHILGAGLN